MSCSDAEFNQCLNAFLSRSHGVPFRQDVRFRDNNFRFKILASRIHVQIVIHNRSKEDGRSLKKVRDDLPGQSSLKAAPVSETFFELDDLVTLERETVFALTIATVVVFVLCLLSSSSFGISSFLAVTFGLLILVTAAIMEAMRILLNHITFTSLLLTIVLAFNFSLSVAQSFLLILSKERSARTHDGSSAHCLVAYGNSSIAGDNWIRFTGVYSSNFQGYFLPTHPYRSCFGTDPRFHNLPFSNIIIF